MCILNGKSHNTRGKFETARGLARICDLNMRHARALNEKAPFFVAEDYVQSENYTTERH